MSDLYNYNWWPNFSKAKLICQHTGLENPNRGDFIYLMDNVQALRYWYGKPMNETSCYRHPTHPLEARKSKPGQHTIAAIDFKVPTEDCHRIVKRMFEMGFKGIGINLTGSHSSRFIHGDFRSSPPRLWSY